MTKSEAPEQGPQLSIEERLSNDKSGAEKEAIEAHLDRLLKDAQTALDDGCKPKEFAKLSKMITAIEAAKEILILA